MSQSRHELPGSFRKAAPDATYVADVDPSDRIELTLVLRRRAELDPETIANGTLSSADLAERFGADPADVDAVRAALPGIEIPQRRRGIAARLRPQAQRRSWPTSSAPSSRWSAAPTRRQARP